MFKFIQVTSPHKVGDGMSSYMAYKITTKTNVNYFKKAEMSVDRRFSDFLGLHDKLSEKYLQNGRIIPPAPDKSVVGMTKVKMSKETSAEIPMQQDEVRKSILLKRLEWGNLQFCCIKLLYFIHFVVCRKATCSLRKISQ